METMETDIVEIPLDFSKPRRATEEERAACLSPGDRKRAVGAFKDLQKPPDTV